MNVEGLKKIYKRLCPKGDASEFAEFVFRTYDTNGDGYVDFQEFITAISMTRRGKHHMKNILSVKKMSV